LNILRATHQDGIKVIFLRAEIDIGGPGGKCGIATDAENAGFSDPWCGYFQIAVNR